MLDYSVIEKIRLTETDHSLNILVEDARSSNTNTVTA